MFCGQTDYCRRNGLAQQDRRESQRKRQCSWTFELEMLSGTRIVITGLAATQTLDSRPCHPGFEAPGFEAVDDLSVGHRKNQ